MRPSFRPTRALAPAVVLALVSPALVSCGLLGGGGHLDDALDLTPEGATSLQFTDREAFDERVGLDDLETGDEDVMDEVVDASLEEPVAGTPLAPYLAPMQDGAFSELDVVWSMTGRLDDEPFTVYRLEDDADLEGFRDDLVDAGFESDEDDERTDLTADYDEVVDDEQGLIEGVYPGVFALGGTTIDTEEHLLVTGAARDAVVETLDGDADSLADAGTFDDVLDGVDDPEYLLALADGVCDVLDDRAVTPDDVARATAATGGLGRPEASVIYLAGDDDPTLGAALQFSDAGAAESDAAAREDYLADGDLVITGLPVDDAFSAEVEQDDDTVRIAVEDADQVRSALRVGVQGDGFMLCGPDA